jgi:hypothetical protein
MKIDRISGMRRGVVLAMAMMVIAGNAYGQKINWGNAAGDVNIDSHGDPLSATFSFQLGTFVDSAGGNPLLQFNPNESNTDVWGANWVPLDTATYNQAAPPNEAQGFFSDSWIPADSTYEGFQAYIWIYNNQAGDASSEWALFTDLGGPNAWLIPASTGSQQNFPTQWRVSTAVDLIFGGLNSVDGPGGTDAGTPSTFAIQTNTVPEPQTPLLVALVLGCRLLCRHRPTGARRSSP